MVQRAVVDLGTVASAVRGVYEHVRRELADLAELSGVGVTGLELWPDPLPEEPGPVRLRARGVMWEMAAHFLFVDRRGFLGVFKAYPGPAWADDLLADLHALAVLRQEQVLSSLLAPSESSQVLSLRPWTLHLFAFVPEPDGDGPPRGDKLWRQMWQHIQSSRLGEEVGLGVLPCGPGAAARADSAGLVDRFLAPLLLKVRRAGCGGGVLDAWRANLRKRLREALAAPDDRRGPWAREQLARVVEDAMEAGPSPSRLRLRALQDVRIRRFAEPTPALPFGRVVVVHGLNGSGKTTLMEAVELALTGRLERLEEVARREGLRAGEVYRRALGLGDEPRGTLRAVFDAGAGPECAGGPGATRDLPVQVGEPNPGLPLSTFYLRQQDVTRFVTAPPAERYTWMAEVLGVPVEAVLDSLHAFDRRLRERIHPFWSKVTGKGPAPNRQDLLKGLADEVRTRLRAAADGMWEGIDEIARYLGEVGVPDGGGPAWALDLRQAIVEAGRARAELDRGLTELEEGLSGRPDPPDDWEQRVAAVAAGFERLRSAHGRLRETRGSLDAFLDPYRQAAEAARSRLDSPAPAPLPLDVGETLQRAESSLAALRTAHRGLRALLAAVDAADTLVRAALRVQQETAALPAPETVTWDEAPAGLAESAARVVANLKSLREEALALARWADSLAADRPALEAAVIRAEAQGRHLCAEVDALRQRVATASATAPSEEPLGEAHRIALARFASELGHPTDATALENRERLRDVLDRFQACRRLLEALELRRIQAPQPLARPSAREPGPDEVLAVLPGWYQRDDDLDRCGPHWLLYLADYVAAQRDAIRRVAQEGIEALLGQEVEALWREIVWTLTAHAWYQPTPGLRVQAAKGKTTVAVEALRGGAPLGRGDTPGGDPAPDGARAVGRRGAVERDGAQARDGWSLGPADAVFNMAELHILGLAWFFVSYLLAGRHACDTVILDDPFQYLDDANLTAFLRNFDEVLRAIGAEQAVLVVHQPAVRDFLRYELASEETATADGASGDAVVFWDVEVTGAETSAVRPTVYAFRQYMAEVPVAVGEQEIRLGGAG